MSLPRKKVDALIRGVNLESDESIEAAVKAILDGASESRNALQDKLEEAQGKVTEYEQAIASKDAEIARLTGDLQTMTNNYETLKNTAGNAAEVQSAFDAYKAEVEGRETQNKQDQAMRSMLRSSGLTREESIDLLMNSMDKSKVEFDGDKVSNSDTVIPEIKSKFAFLWPTEETKGVPGMTPPTGGGKTGMTKADIAKIKDQGERQAAIAANPGLWLGE